MPKVTLEHLGETVDVRVGETIFDVASRIGKPLASACGAKASCGLCRIQVVSGEEHLSPLNEHEIRHLGNVYFITKQRLGCQTTIASPGPITITVPKPHRR